MHVLKFRIKFLSMPLAARGFLVYPAVVTRGNTGEDKTGTGSSNEMKRRQGEDLRENEDDENHFSVVLLKGI